MMHTNRRFVVVDVATAEELAEKLINHDWCTCNGFRFEGHLWLNDSTSPDDAQEYAVVREATMEQVESITVSWLAPAIEVDNGRGGKRPGRDYAAGIAKCLEYIQAQATWNDPFAVVTNPIQTPVQHGTCGACA